MIFAIETSCDETSTAILDFNGIYSSFTCSTQANLSQDIKVISFEPNPVEPDELLCKSYKS